MIGSKHIAIISAVYPPEPLVSARMARDLALYFTGHGNNVLTVCPQPSRPATADFRAYKKSDADLVALEDGVLVVRLPSLTAPQSTLLSRVLESYSFGKHVCRYLDSLNRQPDVIYVNVWPLLAQYLIARYARRKCIPMVLQIMDVYPESLLNKVPVIFKKIVEMPLMKLDQWNAHQAASVVVISENMRRLYAEGRGMSLERLETVNLWQDEELFLPHSDRFGACIDYGVPSDKFTFLYLGNIGPVAGVDLLIRAFHFATIPSAQLLIIGDGAALTACRQLVNRIGAENILFISDPSVAQVPKLQSMADVCLLPVKRGAAMSSIPSKLPAYLFSTKPVLATVDADSDTARAIKDAGCGWVGEPEDQVWLSGKMQEVALMDEGELRSIGEKGHSFGLANFSKTQGVSRLAQIISESIEIEKIIKT